MVSLEKISQEAGVSIRTVSVALNGDPVAGRISESCVQQIKKIAQKYDYKVSAAARAIRLKRTCQVGVLVRNDPQYPMNEPSAYETILGINQQMEQAGYLVCLIRYTDITNRFTSQSRVFKEHVLDGVITIGNIPQLSCDTITKAISTCVWVDNNNECLDHAICRNEYQAGYLAADHVLKLGYRQIYWLGPMPDEPNVHISVHHRYQGMVDRLAQGGLVPKVRLLPRWNPEVTLNNLMETFSRKYVVIAYNSELAEHLGHLALSMGKRVGHDFGLVCCEDSYTLSESWQGMSRVSFDRYAMGQAAADLMLQLLLPNQQKAAPDKMPPLPRIMPVHWIAGNTAWGPGLLN